MQMPQFVYPALLWLLIPIGIGLFWLVRKSFVQENSRFDDESSKKRRKHLRAIVFCTRFIVIAMLLLALATPLVTQSSLRAGDTAITLLIDESASMNLLDKDELPALIERLESEVPLTTHIIASGEDTPLGSAVLSYLKANENVLLITDGHSTSGASLAQVAAYAAQSNSTISAIKLTAKEFDAAIRIDAPAKRLLIQTQHSQCA